MTLLRVDGWPAVKIAVRSFPELRPSYPSTIRTTPHRRWSMACGAWYFLYTPFQTRKF